ncbi:hypothetical protein [Streptomyces sp. P17]|uniref:hypothetical protein n=1 Tax=Streptomyces sp. P17 TaxID=3074716 RepID=UPI0028F40532|nr:hypothetical protein [Streptomyces sp. P17]MDT9698809.1 hypothetical protein [Streptomyces sp. P17]
MIAQVELLAFVPTHPAPPALNSDDIQVRWVMPELFYDLPLHEEDDDEAIRLLEELADKPLPGASEDDKTRFAVICALGFDELHGTGAEYAAIGVIAVDNTPCTATVFATLIDSPDGDGIPAQAKAIASSLRGTKGDEASELELPCGAAVSCIGTRDSKLIGDLTETGESIVFPTSFIRVYIPLPNGTTVVMEMNTPTMTGWETFSTMFGNIVSSVRLFGADGTPLITSGTTA